MRELELLFVYGTLRDGQSARALLGKHILSSQPARTRGRLYAFEAGYPGLVCDETASGWVHGELLRVRDLDAVLPVLDAYEGELFRIETVRVEGGGGVTSARCYVLADAASAQAAREVADGDWVRVVRGS